MIRVMIVDDSPLVRQLLRQRLNAAGDIEVVADAASGRQAIAEIARLQPDVITLDQQMPEMSGIETLRHIMYERPTPVVMVTGVSRQAARVTGEALALGAVDFVLKYQPSSDIDPQALTLEIVGKVRAAAAVKVIRSIRSRSLMRGRLPALVGKTATALPPALPTGAVVVIGASTGGPVALREIISRLPAALGLTLIIVQHIPAGFSNVLAAQLDRHAPLPVREAQHGERLTPGVALVAPGDRHLLIGGDGRVQLVDGPKVNGHRPAIDVTMQSAARHFGSRACAVILTGMGGDGSEGARAIHAAGGVTMVQSAASCVVDAMPQQARQRAPIDFVGAPEEIAAYLQRL